MLGTKIVASMRLAIARTRQRIEGLLSGFKMVVPLLVLSKPRICKRLLPVASVVDAGRCYAIPSVALVRDLFSLCKRIAPNKRFGSCLRHADEPLCRPLNSLLSSGAMFPFHSFTMRKKLFLWVEEWKRLWVLKKSQRLAVRFGESMLEGIVLSYAALDFDLRRPADHDG